MPAKLTEQKIKELLVSQDYISETELGKIEKDRQNTNFGLVEFLLDGGFVTKSILGQAIAEYYKCNYVDLDRQKIDNNLVKKIPEVMIRAKGVAPFEATKDGVKVAMRDPNDKIAIHNLEKILAAPILPFYTTDQDLESVLDIFKASLKDEMDRLLAEIAKPGLAKEKADDLMVKMVDTMLQYGQQNKASDIHIEPYSNKIVVRFRIDGVMHDLAQLPKNLSELILTRIKIMSKMRTDEHRAAQDGKLRFQYENDNVDVRVSVVPTTSGENVVMRILSAKNRSFSLSDLGLNSVDLKKVQSAIKHPHGMIIVAGPTGSGKTTTLYAILKILNRRDVNVATIEDPVEYDIEGITQIQVDPKTDLTFAKGLRTIVRQDPNIIMVGEIRDEETAGISINAALTGHLVLSTLHANDAATTMPRLLDMKVEPFLVASTINIAIAQRLVRKICPSCRISYEMNDEEKNSLEADEEIKKILFKKLGKKLDKLRLYKGEGCQVCSNTGFQGRVGLYEVMELNDDVKKLILKEASSDEIAAAAKENGMTTMFDDGIEKVLQGVTSLEEVLRVTRD